MAYEQTIFFSVFRFYREWKNLKISFSRHSLFSRIFLRSESDFLNEHFDAEIFSRFLGHHFQGRDQLQSLAYRCRWRRLEVFR